MEMQNTLPLWQTHFFERIDESVHLQQGRVIEAQSWSRIAMSNQHQHTYGKSNQFPVWMDILAQVSGETVEHLADASPA
jgi:hypothetical protein